MPKNENQETEEQGFAYEYGNDEIEDKDVDEGEGHEEEESSGEGEEISPEMQKALDGGWRPQDEWEGDPNNWVDYREFNMRGELMDRISSESKQRKALQKQLDKFKVAFKKLGEHNAKMLERQKQTLLKELKEERILALEESDHRGAAEIEDKIAEVSQMDTQDEDLYDIDFDEASEEGEGREQVPEYTPEQVDTLKQWVAQNPWFQNDEIMANATDIIAKKYQDKHGMDDIEGMLEHVNKEIRKEFPHKFNKKPAGQMFNKPSGRGKKPSSKKTYTESDLSPEQLDTARTFVQAGAFKNVAEYAKELAALGELPAQKGE